MKRGHRRFRSKDTMNSACWEAEPSQAFNAAAKIAPDNAPKDHANTVQHAKRELA